MLSGFTLGNATAFLIDRFEWLDVSSTSVLDVQGSFRGLFSRQFSFQRDTASLDSLFYSL
jgi:hypothetical protein